MKQWKVIIALLLSISCIKMGWCAEIEGRWITIDDKTGQRRSVINLRVYEGTLYGKIEEVFKQPGDTGYCHNCPDGFKGKPVKGLQILWGLRQTGSNTWDGGQILDPKTGKIYDVKMTQHGDTLDVRGYIGVSLLGRTQKWVR